MRGWRLLVVACIACGCRQHWTAEVTQPALSAIPARGAQTSMLLMIESRPMPLSIESRGRQRWVRLANTAYYVVVSRDRLRFHVTLRHTWEAMSDLRTWDAWVEDERGVHHELEQIDQQLTLVNSRTVVNPGGVAIYRGTAAFTVYSRNLLAAGHRITLVLRRPFYEYRYVWKSEDDPGTEPGAEPGAEPGG